MPVSRASLVGLMLCALALQAPRGMAAEVEMLHAWAPDDRATAVLKEMLRRQGHAWTDFSIVPGDSNGLLNSLLAARIRSGNPPFGAVIRAPVARDWARQGKLADLGDVAARGQWDAVLPATVRDALKYDGRYVAVPVSLHRSNWLWLNRRLLARVGADAPTDWPGFFEAAERLRRAGIVALAHDGHQRQNLHLFESVALGVGGAEFYRRAFVLRQPSALSSQAMEEVLRTFRRIKPYTGNGASAGQAQRDWRTTFGTLVDDEAAMMFAGDWTAPMFSAARERSGADVACVPTPGAAGAVTYLVDSFALFGAQDPQRLRVQRAFAAELMTPAIQSRFNRVQGSNPARQDLDQGKLEGCAGQSIQSMRSAEDNGRLLPAFPMALSAAAEVGMADIVNAFWNDDSMSERTAMARLAAVLN